ncbi:MAG: lysylphosphatidylglycerol synthase transmembrane domain-containing protein [Candidatus Limnocylindrales bacterium]
MRGRGGLGRAALGIGISVVALALVVQSVDLGAAWEAIRRADARWLMLLVAFIAADVLLRAIRWRVLLGPVAEVPLRATLGSLLVGYLANNVLPARLGELVRSHDLGSRTGLSRSTILGTIVVERVVDTLVVVVIAAIAILVLSVRGVVASAVLVGVAVSGLLVVGIAVGIVAHRLPGAERMTAIVARRPRIHGALVRLRAGLSIASDLRTMVAAVVLSIGSWSCTVLAFAAAAQAVGVEPTIGQAALLAAGTNLATAIPAAPGYVGTFELAAVTIAGSVGIPPASALAFAVLVHAASLLLTSVGGAVALVAGGRGHLRIPVPDGAPEVDP